MLAKFHSTTRRTFLTLKLNEVLIIHCHTSVDQLKMGLYGEKKGVEVFAKTLTPVSILGEPADIRSFASANRTDIIPITTAIIIIIIIISHTTR